MFEGEAYIIQGVKAEVCTQCGKGGIHWMRCGELRR